MKNVTHYFAFAIAGIILVLAQVARADGPTFKLICGVYNNCNVCYFEGSEEDHQRCSIAFARDTDEYRRAKSFVEIVRDTGYRFKNYPTSAGWNFNKDYAIPNQVDLCSRLDGAMDKAAKDEVALSKLESTYRDNRCNSYLGRNQAPPVSNDQGVRAGS